MIRYVVIDMLPEAATHNGVLRERHSKKECNVIAPTCIIFILRIDRKGLSLETFVCLEMQAWPYFWFSLVKFLQRRESGIKR